MKSTKIIINRYFISAQCALIVFVLLIAISDSQPSGEVERHSFQQNDELKFMHEEESIKPNDRGKDSLVRNKRTIGFLRQLFPGLSQVIDRKIQQITRVVFRVVGRLILRGGTAGGGTAGGGTSDGAGGDKGRRISITLPTYPPFEDDEEEDSGSSNSTTSGQTSSPTVSGDANSTSTIATAASTEAFSSISTTPSTLAASSFDTTTPTATTTTGSGSLPDLESNGINDVTKRKVNRRDVSDVLSDSTSSVPTPVEDEANTSEGDKKDNGLFWRLREMRSKRNPFKLGGAQNGGDSGSGNFLFDVVRLIAGSGVTPEKDEELNAPREERQDDGSGGSNSSNDNTISGTSDDTYGAGIPGPLTRLFVLFNRGISNMIQDLILRVAQTSERVINFKARLITSII